MAVQIVSQFFYGASSIVLKGYSSTAQNIVALFRNFAAMKNVKSKALKLAFIINMIMYAAFSLVIMNYVGTLSCTVIAVTTALIKEKNDIPGAETK